MKFERISIPFPKKLMERYEEFLSNLVTLSDENYEIFWDDILTAMENRLKVYKK